MICEQCVCWVNDELHSSARDRWHQENLIAFLECISWPAQKSDVFLVDVDIQESANLSLVIAQVRLQLGELFIEHRKQFAQVRGRAGDRAHSIGVTPQCSRYLNSDRHA